VEATTAGGAVVVAGVIEAVRHFILPFLFRMRSKLGVDLTRSRLSWRGSRSIASAASITGTTKALLNARSGSWQCLYDICVYLL
jgi:hypothetical protein